MESLSTPLSPSPWVSVADLIGIRDKAQEVIAKNQVAALAPFVPKSPPIFNSIQVANLCGLDRNRFENRRRAGDLPNGNETNNRRRVFTLKEALTWIAAYRGPKLRRGLYPGVQCPKGVVITVGNFNEAIGKSATVATLAQGLSLRGHRVLILDLDPQGSLTSMLGVNYETVEDTDTVLAAISGQEQSFANAIQPTYWSGIHLVAAASRLSSAEALLTATRDKDNHAYWAAISEGLDDSIRAQYDVIIITTESRLSALSINAFFAADILVIPVPSTPNGFMSSANTFKFLAELNADFVTDGGLDKGFSFINVLPSRAHSDPTADLCREWLIDAYGKLVLSEIPDLVFTPKNGTVYDETFAQPPIKTNRPAYEAFERVAQIIEGQMHRIWQARAKTAG